MSSMRSMVHCPPAPDSLIVRPSLSFDKPRATVPFFRGTGTNDERLEPPRDALDLPVLKVAEPSDHKPRVKIIRWARPTTAVGFVLDVE
ncbi:MAG: hypothetical protein ABS36_11875 [Acidobacteria bacterium SCN 69-37]|nr:MAG: hypothetical protein ABS36_11875 [Acidobacteria bacterium SCN 69-37]